jgi:hypothetical protein
VVVLCDAFADVVRIAKLDLGVGITLLGGLAVPFGGYRVVLGNAPAVLVE